VKKSVGMSVKWTPQIESYELAPQVLVVARTRVEGAWRAYVGCVPSAIFELDEVHREIFRKMVLDGGEKVPEALARIMFPQFKDLEYAK